MATTTTVVIVVITSFKIQYNMKSKQMRIWRTIMIKSMFGIQACIYDYICVVDI